MNWDHFDPGEVSILIVIGIASIRADVLLAHISHYLELLVTAKGMLPQKMADKLNGGSSREKRAPKDKWMAHEIEEDGKP